MKGRWAAILSGWLVGWWIIDRLVLVGWLFTCWLVGWRVALVGTLRCYADWTEIYKFYVVYQTNNPN